MIDKISSAKQGAAVFLREAIHKYKIEEVEDFISRLVKDSPESTANSMYISDENIYSMNIPAVEKHEIENEVNNYTAFDESSCMKTPINQYYINIDTLEKWDEYIEGLKDFSNINDFFEISYIEGFTSDELKVYHNKYKSFYQNNISAYIKKINKIKRPERIEDDTVEDLVYAVKECVEKDFMRSLLPGLYEGTRANKKSVSKYCEELINRLDAYLDKNKIRSINTIKKGELFEKNLKYLRAPSYGLVNKEAYIKDIIYYPRRISFMDGRKSKHLIIEGEVKLGSDDKC